MIALSGSTGGLYGETPKESRHVIFSRCIVMVYNYSQTLNIAWYEVLIYSALVHNGWYI